MNVLASCTQNVLMEHWREENDKEMGHPLYYDIKYFKYVKVLD